MATAQPATFADNELAARLLSLQPGDLLTLVGIDAAGLAAHVTRDMPPLLRLDLAGAMGTQAMLARILDDLAELALAAWPNWPPSPLAPWRRAADRLAAAGRRPRFSARVPAQTQFCALHPAAGGPALTFQIEAGGPERAAQLIATMEWVRRHGAAAVAVLPELPQPTAPWDRVMYGALAVTPAPSAPASARLVPPPAPGMRGSAVERRMRAALRATADLAALFEDEVTLRLGPLGPTPRVDLLWREGRVVVELDGAEHERDPNYGADRHRDYELMVAGYLVLRLTNDEVELDLERALEKVRRVVALRRERA
jgi:hypothetical protein